MPRQGSELCRQARCWDITPAMYQHDGTYSIVIKNNHYGGVGSYCNDEAFCPSDRTGSNPNSPEEYFVTQLSPATNPVTGMMTITTMLANLAADLAYGWLDPRVTYR